MKAEEKLDQEVDRLWQQMRYAYEHGGGHAGHLNNAWHTAMRLSKELRRLHEALKAAQYECGFGAGCCYQAAKSEADEALLRQALEALELRCGTNADERKELIPALRERLGETK